MEDLSYRVETQADTVTTAINSVQSAPVGETTTLILAGPTWSPYEPTSVTVAPSTSVTVNGGITYNLGSSVITSSTRTGAEIMVEVNFAATSDYTFVENDLVSLTLDIEYTNL